MKPSDLFSESSDSETFQKGDFVFRQGEQSQYMYLIQKGLLKASYFSEDGSESVKSFLSEGDVIGSLVSLRSEQPCSFSLICLEECRLAKLPFQLVYEQSKSDIALSNFLVEGLLNLAMKKERREYEFLCLSASERYQLFVERFPDIHSRVTQNELSKYLGITHVALSRIRKRLSENG